MRPMIKLLKWFTKTILFIIILGILYLNYSLYYTPSFVTSSGKLYNEDVYHQLQFLKEKMHQGAGNEMQELFPEGFIFINALYGLSWCNLITPLTSSSDIYQEGLKEIEWAFQEIDSDEGIIIFDKSLPLPYGAYYRGWSNYLLGKWLQTQPIAERDTNIVARFQANCTAIATALSNVESPFLESYSNQVWPADGTIAVASLSLHDQLFSPSYTTTTTTWLNKVKSRLDPATGLIPHSTYPDYGAVLEGARGSSQSLILCFLKDIDPIFAQKQYERYEELFLDYRFGLPGIREYPKGQEGNGDIDSGPVLLGIGGAASIVGQKTMATYENWTIYEGLRNAIEGFGVPYTWQRQKRYIFGLLPMADAFIAWSNSIEKKEYINSNWKFVFQIISLAVLLIIASCYYFLFFSKK